MDYNIKWNYENLISTYLTMKIKLGFEPSFTKEELASFLDSATYFVYVTEPLTYQEGVERYLESHQDMFVRKDDGTYVPTYNFKYRRVNYAHITGELNYTIDDFLNRYSSRRMVASSDMVTSTTRDFCERVTAIYAAKIWQGMILNYIKKGLWPKQCDDVEKFVVDADLAHHIDLPIMQDDLLAFYSSVSSRMMQIAGEDDFQMSNDDGYILANTNFNYVMGDYNYIYPSHGYLRTIKTDRALNIVTDTNPTKLNNWAAAAEVPLDCSEVLNLTRSIKKHLEDR